MVKIILIEKLRRQNKIHSNQQFKVNASKNLIIDKDTMQLNEDFNRLLTKVYIQYINIQKYRNISIHNKTKTRRWLMKIYEII